MTEDSPFVSEVANELSTWPGVKVVLTSMSIALSDILSAPGDFSGDPREAAKFHQNLPNSLQDRIHWIDEMPPESLVQKGTP